MKQEPETYEELIRTKRCIDLTKYYELSKEELDEIYIFLTENPQGGVIGGKSSLCLSIPDDNSQIKKVINAKCIDPSIDGVEMSNEYLGLIPHYVPGSSSSPSDGRSSNNNNNNNNNSNNNNNNNR